MGLFQEMRAAIRLNSGEGSGCNVVMLGPLRRLIVSRSDRMRLLVLPAFVGKPYRCISQDPRCAVGGTCQWLIGRGDRVALAQL